MELSIQERLKDLRVERGLTLEQLAEQTHLSKSALGSYEGDKFKDISHYALIELAKFYEVTVDYLLGRSQTKNHPNADLADLRLSDAMIELLKSGLVDNSLLCELATHPDFPRLMADLEIYVNGVAGKQVQSANAIVDAVSATISYITPLFWYAVPSAKQKKGHSNDFSTSLLCPCVSLCHCGAPYQAALLISPNRTQPA